MVKILAEVLPEVLLEVLLERVWNTIFFLLCVAGCSFQLINIATSYFSYRTVTRNRYHEPRMIHYPELHYCFLYLQNGLDWPAIELKYGKIFPWSNLTEILKWHDVLTIEDIFLFTPRAEIEECSEIENVLKSRMFFQTPHREQDQSYDKR